MARMLVTLDGRTESKGSPVVMHNPRLADPLDPFSREIAKISKKRGKTEADHLEIALLEFVGGLYHDGADEWLRQNKQVEEILLLSDPTVNGSEAVGPYIPGEVVLRSIQAAARQHKLGKAIERGFSPVTLKAPLQYEGPREPDALWREGRFALRKSVGIQSSRTIRTRPVFLDWQLECEFEIDLNIIDPDKINQFAQESGRYFGIGDYRSGGYGRSLGMAIVVSETSKTKAVKA